MGPLNSRITAGRDHAHARSRITCRTTSPSWAPTPTGRCAAIAISVRVHPRLAGHQHADEVIDGVLWRHRVPPGRKCSRACGAAAREYAPQPGSPCGPSRPVRPSAARRSARHGHGPVPRCGHPRPGPPAAGPRGCGGPAGWAGTAPRSRRSCAPPHRGRSRPAQSVGRSQSAGPRSRTGAACVRDSSPRTMPRACRSVGRMISPARAGMVVNTMGSPRHVWETRSRGRQQQPDRNGRLRFWRTSSPDSTVTRRCGQRNPRLVFCAHPAFSGENNSGSARLISSSFPG